MIKRSVRLNEHYNLILITKLRDTGYAQASPTLRQQMRDQMGR
ncbi:MAG: hypothetical protein AAGF24_03075 [Cyanobacteria bacterium P01_H01_bin.121]